MRRLVFCLAIACGYVASWGNAQAMAQTYRPGDHVVVIADAKLRIDGQKEVDPVWPGLVLKVGAVNGAFVWLSNGKPGWLEQRFIIPLDRRAIDHLTQLINAKPRSANLYSGRADVWQHLGELDIALADYNEAIRLVPTSSAYYNNRGRVWNAKKDHDKALSDYNEAIRLDLKYAPAYIGRGTAWENKGEYDKAIADYNEAIRLDLKNAYAFANRGFAWQGKKEYDKAIADYNEAIRLDPKDASSYRNRGFAFNQRTEYDKAIADYNEAIRLDPKDSNTYSNRGGAWISLQKYDKAIADSNEAIRIDPKNAYAFYNRAVCRLVTRHTQAVNDCQAVIDIQGWTGDRAVYALILGHLSARLMADEAKGKPFLQDSVGKLNETWPEPVVRYLRGELTEEALLALATDNDQKTDASCFIGLADLAAGRIDKATAHFEWVRMNGNRSFIEYEIAVWELKRPK